MVKDTCKVTTVVDMPLKDVSSSGDSINTKATMKMEYMRWYDSDSDDEFISDESSNASVESTTSSNDSVSKGTATTDEDSSSEADLTDIKENVVEPSAEVKTDRGIFAVLNPTNVAGESSSKTVPGKVDAQLTNHHQLEELLLKVASKDQDLADRND